MVVEAARTSETLVDIQLRIWQYSQKTPSFMLVAVRTWNLTYWLLFSTEMQAMVNWV
jgi:hypothetical protein